MSLFLLHIGFVLFWMALIGTSVPDFIVGTFFAWLTIIMGESLWYNDAVETDGRTLSVYPFRQLRSRTQMKKELGGLMGIGHHFLSYLWLIIFYIWVLLQSTFIVILHTLGLRGQEKPGIIALPLEAERNVEIVLLNALITMSPGTLGVDVRFFEEDGVKKRELYVHCLHVPNPEDTLAELLYLQRVLLFALRGSSYLRGTTTIDIVEEKLNGDVDNV